jgi:TRAP-type mannitol/chloroaromatic compound transport system substrate-binding protein
MSSISRRTLIKGASIAIGAGVTLSAPALAKGNKVWRMITSWPKDLQGPGVSAQRVADTITALSNQALTVEVFPAGTITPAMGVLDAISSDGIEMGHTATAFDSGKDKIAPLFTGLPGGLTPLEHQSWIETAGGQELWDQLYAPLNIKPLMAGNTGPSMGGWFRKPIQSLTDLKGLTMRMPGLGAEVFSQLGVTCVSLSPGETFTSLQSGVIDAAEFASPASDMGLGLHQVAQYYYGPGLHEPNGVGALYIDLKEWNALTKDLQTVVQVAAAQEHARALAETVHVNSQALRSLIDTHAINVLDWPTDVQRAIAEKSRTILDMFEENKVQTDIKNSYRAFQDLVSQWSRMSMQNYLSIR